MPKVHRCGEHGCREMIPLGYRYCEKHYKQHYNDYLHQQSTRQAVEGYRYHTLRRAKYYDQHKRLNKDENADKENSVKDLAKSFDIKTSDKNEAKNMSQSSRAKFYYSKPWQKVRTAIANRDMNICQVCGRSLHRMYVDHIIPLSVCDDSQRLDAENLWTLCGGCHNHKTRCEEKMTAKELKIQTKSDWMRRLQKKARP